MEEARCERFDGKSISRDRKDAETMTEKCVPFNRVKWLVVGAVVGAVAALVGAYFAGWLSF